MNKKFYLHIATAILISVLGVSANAQSRNRQELKVSVPFAFNVGNTELPAGDYTVRVVNPTSDSSVLQIASVDGKFTTMVRTIDVEGWAKSTARLTFRHYGSQYFLAQVWMAAESNGFAAPNSSNEKNLRRQLGKTAKNVDLVAVNAQ
jgi:pectate lyase